MLRAAPPGHPLQKPTVVQWDIGAMLSADGAADESVSPQSGITWQPTCEHEARMTEQCAESPRRPGRPRGSRWLPADFRQDVWLEVEAVREQIRLRTGRRPSIIGACDVIARRGGLIWIVGGNIAAVTAAMASARKAPFSRWRRFKLRNGNARHIVTDKAGRIIVCHLLQNARSIRT